MATYKIKRKTATNGSTEEILLPISSIDGLQTALDGKQASGSYATTSQVNAKYTKPSGGIPKTDLASAVQTSLGKADTALQSYTETDPTVPSWAKASSKPSYAASEISGLATVATSGKYSDLSGKPTIPTKTSQLTNDSGFKTTDNNTTYSLSKSGSTITLTGSDGSTTSVTDSNTQAVSSVNNKTGAVSLGASDVGALSLDGGTINTSKTIKMNASTNANGANLKWGTVNSKNPYIGYASDQTDGTFVIGSLLGTNYASGLAIGGGSGNLLWKGTKVATTSDIPSVPTVNNGTLTITENGVSKGTFTANQSGNTTIALTNTTYSNATTSTAGLMSAADKTKLDSTYGANTITGLYVAGGETSATVVDSSGITCSIGEIEIEMSGGDNYNYCGGQFQVPIVAGSNISTTKNDSDKAVISYTCGTWSSGTSGTVKLPSAGTYQVRSSASYTSVLWWDGASQAHSPLIRAKAIGTCYRFSVATSGTLTLKEGTLATTTETNKTSTIYYRRIGD